MSCLSMGGEGVLDENKPRICWTRNWSLEEAKATINLETWTALSTRSPSHSYIRNHEGAMSSWATAEWWSWAPAPAMLPTLSPPWPLPGTEYTPQKDIVLPEPGKGPRKMTIDLVIDGSSRTASMSRWKMYDSRMLLLPPSRERWLNSKCRTWFFCL